MFSGVSTLASDAVAARRVSYRQIREVAWPGGLWRTLAIGRSAAVAGALIWRGVGPAGVGTSVRRSISLSMAVSTVQARDCCIQLQVLAVGLLERGVQGLRLVTVLFLEVADLAGQGLDDRVVAVGVAGRDRLQAGLGAQVLVAAWAFASDLALAAAARAAVAAAASSYRPSARKARHHRAFGQLHPARPFRHDGRGALELPAEPGDGQPASADDGAAKAGKAPQTPPRTADPPAGAQPPEPAQQRDGPTHDPAAYARPTAVPRAPCPVPRQATTSPPPRKHLPAIRAHNPSGTTHRAAYPSAQATLTSR